MPTPFSRTLSSVRADTFRGTRIALLSGVFLLALWLLWLFLARIPSVETSVEVWREGSRLVARFRSIPLERIQPGQSARVRWADAGQGMTDASVVRAAGDDRDQSVRVELAVDSTKRVLSNDRVPREVEIEVSQTTPASLLARRAGVRQTPVKLSGR